MKTKLALLVLALTAVRLAADVLPSDTAVFIQTDPQSPVLVRLKAGATLATVGEAPAGWRRVEVPGPFELYVHNRDITKGLEVREGANILAAPRKDAPVVTVAQKGDRSEITGLRGDWSQIRLEKKLQGFVAVGETANTPAGTRTTPAATPPPLVAPVASPSTALGHPVALTGDTADMPRLFTGTLVLARRAIFNPNPPYDYQLTDSNGRRFAYLDTKRLVLTEKIETFLDRAIVITGTVRNTIDGKDLVVDAQVMQLK